MAKKRLPPTVSVTVRLPRYVAARLKGLAKSEKIPATEIVVDALERYFDDLGDDLPVDRDVLGDYDPAPDPRTPFERIRDSIRRR